MPLIHADVKGLEVVTAGFLSQDPVLCSEIWENYKNPQKDDLHTSNQKEFGLPDRVIAKRFTFKLLYGGTDYGFSIDPLFNHVSKSQQFWTGVIEKFYRKYSGISDTHSGWVRTALETGQLVMPTGRVYSFPARDVARREWFWRPKILNYPVQGTGADLVAIARVSAWKRLRKAEIPVVFQSTVHDSIDIDVESCYNIRVVEIIRQAIRDVPKNFERLFGVPFNVPLNCEISYGPNLKLQTQVS